MVLVLHFILRIEFQSHKIQILLYMLLVVTRFLLDCGGYIPRTLVFYRAALLSSNAPNPPPSCIPIYPPLHTPVSKQPTHWHSPAPPPGLPIPLAWSTSCNLMLSLCNADSSYLGKDCTSPGCAPYAHPGNWVLSQFSHAPEPPPHYYTPLGSTTDIQTNRATSILSSSLHLLTYTSNTLKGPKLLPVYTQGNEGWMDDLPRATRDHSSTDTLYVNRQLSMGGEYRHLETLQAPTNQ